jgi:hypothetical protein
MKPRLGIRLLFLYAWPSNGLELTGDGGAAAGVRCSDVLGARVIGLVAMGLLPPYARDGGSSRCQGVHRASGAGGGALMLRNP